MDPAIEAARACYSETSFKGDILSPDFLIKIWGWGCQFSFHASLLMYLTTTIIVL
jgi:hypothetical protein